MNFTLKDLFAFVTFLAIGIAMMVAGRNVLQHDPRNSTAAMIAIIGFFHTISSMLWALGRVLHMN